MHRRGPSSAASTRRPRPWPRRCPATRRRRCRRRPVKRPRARGRRRHAPRRASRAGACRGRSTHTHGRRPHRPPRRACRGRRAGPAPRWRRWPASRSGLGGLRALIRTGKPRTLRPSWCHAYTRPSRPEATTSGRAPPPMSPIAGVARNAACTFPIRFAAPFVAKARPLRRGQPRTSLRVRPFHTRSRPSVVPSTISGRPSPVRSASCGDASPELPQAQRIAALQSPVAIRVEVGAVLARGSRSRLLRCRRSVQPPSSSLARRRSQPRSRHRCRCRPAASPRAPRPGRARASSARPPKPRTRSLPRWVENRSGEVMLAPGGIRPALAALHRLERVHPPVAGELVPALLAVALRPGQVVGGPDHRAGAPLGRGPSPGRRP